MTDTQSMPITQALTEIMKEVGAVKKGDRNNSQGFNFRGIDAVVNAVSPALQKFGVIVFPEVIDYQYDTVEIGKNRTAMGHVKVKVSYTFIGAGGDALKTTVAAEAMDSGDKATAKAMSVAFRTALLQTLALPTDEPDPDASSYERSSKQYLDASPILAELQTVENLDALSKIGAKISSNSNQFSPEDLDHLRAGFKAATTRLSTPKVTDEPTDDLS